MKLSLWLRVWLLGAAYALIMPVSLFGNAFYVSSTTVSGRSSSNALIGHAEINRNGDKTGQHSGYTGTSRKAIQTIDVHNPAIKGKILNQFPKVNTWYDRLSFGWVKDIMERGNRKPLEMRDLWLLPESKQMRNTSAQFHEYFQAEIEVCKAQNYSMNKYENKSVNILMEFWGSPLTRAVVKM